jgi:hypothetical protein
MFELNYDPGYDRACWESEEKERYEQEQKELYYDGDDLVYDVLGKRYSQATGKFTFASANPVYRVGERSATLEEAAGLWRDSMVGYENEEN